VAQNHGADFMLLATAIINIQNKSGSWVPCRALLESGSQLHISTSRLTHTLQLPKHKFAATVSGIGEARFRSDECMVNINLKLQSSLPTSQLCYQPNLNENSEDWKIPANLCLADPQFFRPQKIDMLIGASLFIDLLCVAQIKLADGLPFSKILVLDRLSLVVASPLTRFYH